MSRIVGLRSEEKHVVSLVAVVASREVHRSKNLGDDTGTVSFGQKRTVYLVIEMHEQNTAFNEGQHEMDAFGIPYKNKCKTNSLFSLSNC